MLFIYLMKKISSILKTFLFYHSQKPTTSQKVVQKIQIVIHLLESFEFFFYFQEAAQALIYAEMAGSSLEHIQEKINEYLERVQALHSAGKDY